MPFTETTCSMVEAFSLFPRELIALVGGGGKSTLMRTLAEEARSTGRRAIATTTTKVRIEEAKAIGRVAFCRGDHLPVVDFSCRHTGLFIGREGVEAGKIGGISPESADILFSRYLLDLLIVEADGAAGKPLKAPAAHEPVIPSSTTLVVAVVGLEAIGRPVSEESIFRMERFEIVTGLKRGEAVSAESVLPLFYSPHGLFKNCPSGARKAVLLNKADLLADAGTAASFAEMILAGSQGELERVVVGSIARKRFEVFTRDVRGETV